MVWLLLLALVSVFGGAWEITVAFTTDLHASLPRLPALEELLQGADLILDGGDAWEDPRHFTDEFSAWETMRWMAKNGYSAMVLGNHETYLGPRLLGRILGEASFPVLATNLRVDIPTKRWALLERKGVRILLLGVLWDLAMVWPGWEIRDPLVAILEALKDAPEYDLFLLLGHLDTERAKKLVEALPVKPALFILGHDHKMYEEPLWVQGVPIVQAGSFGKAVGLAVLSESGLKSYRLVKVPKPAELPGPPLWLFALLFLFLWGIRV